MVKLGEFYKYEESVNFFDTFQSIPGIYCLQNTVTKKRYVGESESVGSRLCAHFSLLRRGKHYNKHIQRAYNKYGESSFKVAVLAVCEYDELESSENYFVRKWDTVESGYNFMYPDESKERFKNRARKFEKRVTPEKVKKLRELFVKGCSLEYLAERFSINRKYCGQISRNKAPSQYDPNYHPPCFAKNRGFSFTEEQIDKLLELFNSGAPISEVSKAIGTHDTSVASYLKYAGINYERVYHLILDTETGIYYGSITQVSLAYNITKDQVKSILSEPNGRFTKVSDEYNFLITWKKAQHYPQ